jgi:hypothetical protein
LGCAVLHDKIQTKDRRCPRNRWVRTPKWEAEHAAHKALFGSWGNPATSDPSVLGKDGGVVNTNIVWHPRRRSMLAVRYQFCGLSAEITVYAENEAEARAKAADQLRRRISPRQFPPLWSIEETDACFIVREAGEKLKFEPHRQFICSVGHCP